MILELESYKRDTRLIGKAVDILVLKRQFEETEALYDRETIILQSFFAECSIGVLPIPMSNRSMFMTWIQSGCISRNTEF